jgi:hypothetical protein
MPDVSTATVVKLGCFGNWPKAKRRSFMGELRVMSFQL